MNQRRPQTEFPTSPRFLTNFSKGKLSCPAHATLRQSLLPSCRCLHAFVEHGVDGRNVLPATIPSRFRPLRSSGLALDDLRQGPAQRTIGPREVHTVVQLVDLPPKGWGDTHGQGLVEDHKELVVP